VIEKTLGARVGARAANLRSNGRRINNGRVFHACLKIAGLGVAAIFFAWLVSSESRYWQNTGMEWDCSSMGRAGAHCIRRAPNADQPGNRASAGDCLSVGRAGRICLQSSRD
jgi:hypothetical protein